MSTASAKRPFLTLNNGVTLSAFGLGVFLTAPGEAAGSVVTKVADCYRLINISTAYRNERRGVGDRQPRSRQARVSLSRNGERDSASCHRRRRIARGARQ